MKPHRLFLTLLAAWLATPLAQAQTQVLPLPLSGPAYQLAQQAYASSARGDYQRAQAQLREAIRLRPDSPELRRQLRQLREQRAAGAASRDAGYADASAAYRATAAGRHDDAVRLARQAVAKSPRNDAYWLLLGNALNQTRQYEQAQQALAQGQQMAGSSAPLQRRQLELRREMAAMQAALAMQAQQRNDAAGEVAAAQMAVQYAPENISYRLLLATALLRDEQLQQAEQVADEARARDEYRAGPLLLRAYARLRQGREQEAMADFAQARALARGHEQLPARLLEADAELALQRPQRALDLLDDDSVDMSDQMRAAQWRQTRLAAQQALTRYRRAALALHDDAAPLSAKQFPVPSLDCSAGAALDGCLVAPGAVPRDRGYDQALIAYRAMDERDYARAAEAAGAAVQLAPGNLDYRALQLDALVAAEQWVPAEQAATDAVSQQAVELGPMLARRGAIRERLGRNAEARADYRAALDAGGLPLASEITLLANTGRSRQAREKFIAGRDAGALDDLDDLQMAYLAQRAGDSDAAQAAFSRADVAGKLPDNALEDAAFAALHEGDDSRALAWFERSVDAADGGRIERTDQQRFDTRRAISSVDRSVGATASIMRSGGGPSAGNGGRPGASSRASTLQAGAELWWRPFGYMDGRTVEVFGRAFQTLQDQSGGSTGAQTAQATVGARWKPFSSQNVVVSMGRLVPLGSQASADWLAQLAYSDGIGTDLRADRASWWTTQWYAEAGRYLQHPQTYGVASLQAGRSVRLDNILPGLVAFPHLTLNTDYNSLNSNRSATGFGPGINLRYWFRADTYHAPRASLDLSLQYRFKIQGDERAKGFFVTTTLSY
ncbi:bacteriophage N4 adsorption protein A [Herbaspirillum sp. alder98]|uniref:bacteriophage N4 adsorption protein A n=1 Tax=Herbaspirillum sp. alder98 TaxID=2913096 RepID=UPI001CD8BD15|nr:bacteriophage N4 adsorption protein A [Herbaspirillum sp. alder98]MCA1325869.1 bacteriophage N4 adsorption protein A [Herbaspirillum sp. alder98]